MFSKDSKLDLVEGVGGDCLVNCRVVTKVVQKCILRAVRLNDGWRLTDATDRNVADGLAIEKFFFRLC